MDNPTSALRSAFDVIEKARDAYISVMQSPVRAGYTETEQRFNAGEQKDRAKEVAYEELSSLTFDHLCALVDARQALAALPSPSGVDREKLARIVREEIVRQYRENERGRCPAGAAYYEEHIGPEQIVSAILAALPQVAPLDREQVADALCKSYGVDPEDFAPLSVMCTANNEPVIWREVYAEQAEAVCALAKADQLAASGVQGREGWKLVPREPTDAMVIASETRSDQGSINTLYHEIWRAMYDAAPTTSGEG